MDLAQARQELSLAVFENSNASAVADLVARVPELIPLDIQRLNSRYINSACADNNEELLRVLIRLGAPVTSDDVYQDPLVAVSGECSTRMLAILLENGAKINWETDDGPYSHALGMAIISGSLEACKYLVDQGAVFNTLRKKQTCLSLALQLGKDEIADFLRSKGAKTAVEMMGEEQKVMPVTLSEETIEQVQLFFGPAQADALHYLGPANVTISIHVIPANDNCELTTLFTNGLAANPMNVPTGEDQWSRAELYMQLPSDWKIDQTTDPIWGWPFLWLRELAQLPAKNDTWFGGKLCTIDLQELSPELRFTGCLLWAEHFFQSQALSCQIVTLYRVVPLTREEISLERQNGIEALLDAMDKAGVPLEVSMNRVAATN